MDRVLCRPVIDLLGRVRLWFVLVLKQLLKTLLRGECVPHFSMLACQIVLCEGGQGVLAAEW